jgi:hypothetical protein
MGWMQIIDTAERKAQNSRWTGPNRDWLTLILDGPEAYRFLLAIGGAGRWKRTMLVALIEQGPDGRPSRKRSLDGESDRSD